MSKRLDELGFVGRGRSRHRPRDAAHLYGGQFPFIQTGDVKHADLYITNYEQTYSEAGLAQSKQWKAGTLCITIAANIADTAILCFDACFPDSIIGFIPDDDKADARYIKYLFDALLQKKFKKFTQGAAQDNLSLEKLLSMQFPVPSLKIQREVASILSAYDNLIENNRRRIQLLEESARLLYKEWFVYLRFLGHEHVKVVDGVPEGWERMPLENALVLQRGFDLPSHERKDGPIPVYASTGINGTHSLAKVIAPGVVTGRSGSLGVVHYIHEDFWPLNTTLWVKEFKQVSPLFAYFLLSSLRLDQYNGGVSVPTLDRKVVHKIPVVIPDCKIRSLFDEYAMPILAQVRQLQLCNKKLKQARDLLLPRLMNGEIEV